MDLWTQLMVLANQTSCSTQKVATQNYSIHPFPWTFDYWSSNPIHLTIEERNSLLSSPSQKISPFLHLGSSPSSAAPCALKMEKCHQRFLELQCWRVGLGWLALAESALLILLESAWLPMACST